ncbi:MAG: SpvB/TcaC N-terminal domain-containing protein, partial [Nitrospira sp.]
MTWIIYWRHWHIAGRGTVLVAVLILSAWPVAAQDIGESSAVTEAFTIGDVTPSLPSAAVSLGAGNAAKVRSVPVSARGTYTTSIPIQVPPGRLGMTPSLALTYDSGAFRQDSAVGAGWALAIPRISRSTLYGFPKLKQTGDGFIYDEDQTRFEASGGEMVALESAAAKPRAVYNDAVFYAPLRETEPVRYEYSFGQNAWVEHRPDGVKRYYGRDGNRQARIRNELGTAAWLLLREVDRHGNAIRYDYHFSASQNRADKFKPQDEPMLSQVSWGGHLSGHDPFRVAIKLANSLPHGAPNLMHGNTQTLGEVSRIVVCGPEQSFPRASGAPFSLSKSSSDCPDSLYWTYELRIKNSDDTGRKLLTQVRRTNPWSDPQRIWTMQYQSNGGRVEFASPEPLVSGGDPKDQLLFTRYGDRLAILGKTTERAMHPQETSVGTRFVDLNHDGRTDIVYHPSGLSTPEAGIVRDGTIDPPYNWFLAEQPNYDKFARSRLRTSGGDWTNFTLESLGFQEGTYVPNGRFGYSDLADVDGDGRLDGVYFNAQITDNFTPNRRGLSCFSETFWRTCGAIDPPKSDMCKLSNICEQLGELDMTMCVNGQCWITPSDLESLFKDWANWAQVSVLSQQGQKAVQDHGGSIDFRQKLIRVPAAQLRARLKLALGEKPYVTRVRVLRVNAMQQCEALIKGCAGGKLDGVPGPRISFDFDSTRTKLGWGNQAPSSEPRVLPPLYRMGYHAGGGSPDRVAPTIALLGWPAAVYKATMLTMKDSSSFIESWIAKPVSDFSAPLTDLNGDGLADLTLLKSSQITMASALRPEMEFTPRAFLARRHPTPASNEPPLKMELDWKSFFYQYPDAVVPGSPVSGFTQSLQDILVKPGASYCNAVDCLPVEQLTYPIGPNFNSFLLDLNGDGLPDLVSAVPDMDKKCPAKGPRGHEVFLNRGYRFGISASAAARPLSSKGYTHTDTEPYGPFKILLKRDLDGLGNCQLLLGDSLPMTAAAFTDINADGRLDVVFQWQGISEPISHYVFLNRGTRFQEITRPYGLPSVPLAMISSETLKYPKGTQMGDLARLEDVDNDGLVDMVVAGMFCLPIHPECNSSFYPIRSDPGSAPPWKLVGDYKVFPALVYRNKGTVPDLLTRVEESSGSSAEIRYAPARLGPVTSDWVPPGIQVVKSITSRAGADSSEAVVQLSYENYVKAAESPESLGFERVTAEFEDRDGTLVTGHHRQTRVFDVRPAVSGVSLAYPGKGLVLETSSEADGRRERTLVSQVFLPHGAGVSIRVDATDNLSCTLRPDGSCNPNAHTGSRTQTLARDSFGFVTESVVGDLVNGAISNIHRVRTVTT